MKGEPTVDADTPREAVALFEAIREHANDDIEVIDVETDINDSTFARTLVDELTGFMD